MNRKRLLPLLLTNVLIASLVFTGCNKTETDVSGKQGKDPSTEKPYDITMTVLTISETPKDLQLVEEEINKVAISETNTKVKLLPFSIAEYQQKLNLMLSSGEKLDLALTGQIGGFGTLISKGQLNKLDDLYAKYGTDIKNSEGIAMGGGYFNGNLYAIPSEEKMGRQNGCMIKTKNLTKYGIDPKGIKSYEDMDAIFRKIHNGDGSVLGLMGPIAASFGLFNLVDTLGSTPASGGILNGGQDSTKIVNVFATPEYKNHVKWMQKWYQAGIILKDAATTTDAPTDLFRAGRAFGILTTIEPGMEEAFTNGVGESVTGVPLTKSAAMTNMYQTSMWSIPINCKNPEATMKFLNLTYKSEKLVNLFSNGIEGKHYVKTDKPMIIKYPDGIDAKTTGYASYLNIYGDKMKKYSFEPTKPSLYDNLKTFNGDVSKNGASKTLGYVFNGDSVKTEFAAVTSVISEYQASLETGSVDVDNVLPKFLDKLKSAGIDKIIAENQKQLDAWKAKQGK